MLGCEPITESERAGVRGAADLDGYVTVANDRAGHIAATVQVEHGSSCVSIGRRRPLGRNARDLDGLQARIVGSTQCLSEGVEPLTTFLRPNGSRPAGEQ